MSLQIHEFSRELIDTSQKNGRLVSGGFGFEVGPSKHEVPEKIKDAVNSGDFRINDSYPPDEQEYALIARKIDDFSVLAVATGEVDDKNRPLVAYRYFWLEKPEENEENIDGIGILLTWWLNAREPKFAFLEAQNSNELSYSAIDFSSGLGEGVSWRLRSVEGKTRKAMQRLRKGTLYGLEAGFLAAVGVEILRRLLKLGGYEDPLGFLILGLTVGLFLSFATSPTYQVALRAGEGFEAVDSKYDDTERTRPYLNNRDLRFVTLDDYKFIEEGLSIQLLAIRKKQILVGSSPDADIVIPNLSLKAASLEVNERNVTLSCLTEGAVQLQSKRLAVGGKSVTLRHNQILTLFHALDEDKYYRFVFYDKFLDPEA